MMKQSITTIVFSIVLGLASSSHATAAEIKLARSPHYHNGRIAFHYLGDIWTADESGSDARRITAHTARDIDPRFSPDGKWIAFSSDRSGNMDVYIVPVVGGRPKALTFHTAEDDVLGWSPDSKNVLFSSRRGESFMGKLYVVSVDGGMPRDVGADMGVQGCFSPDGTKIAINRKSQAYWRKYYRGAYQSDVTVMNLASKTFEDLTDFDGMDSWPMWGRDGYIYFVSDRDGGGLTNIWRVAESGGKANAEKVTSLGSGDVRKPSISADGKTIVFEHDNIIWKWDIDKKEAKPIRLDLAAEPHDDLTVYREFRSQVDDFSPAPDGKKIAFSIHGEIFTAATSEGGELVAISSGPPRERYVDYSPDGKTIAFVSDRDGGAREEIYLVPADGSKPPKKLTDVDSLKSSFVWSPDGKRIAFTTSDGDLYTCNLEGETKKLASSNHGPLGTPAWSPDGKWIAFSRPDLARSSDIMLIPSTGGEEHRATFDAARERDPKFSADGLKLYFVRTEGEMNANRGERPESRLYVVPLERLDRDPEEADESTPGRPGGAAGGMFAGTRPGGAQPVREANIDWSGLKRRTRVTARSLSVFSFLPGLDSKTIYAVASEGAGAGSGPGIGGGGRMSSSIYVIEDDGKRFNRIVAGVQREPAQSGGPPTPRGGFGRGFGGISGLALTRDGRTLFYQEGESVYSTSVGGGGGGGRGPAGGGLAARGGARPDTPGAAPTGDSGGAPAAIPGRKRVEFLARVKIDKPAEWLAMFDDAWRTMKYRFYDPKMHGYDWDAIRLKYRPLVEHVGDTHELMNVINEMIGELNASHTGATAAPERRGGGGGESSFAAGSLGFDLVPDESAGRYKVTYIYEEGPADKDWIKVSKGDYLIAIDGAAVKAGDNYWEILAHRLNRKVRLTLNSKPTDEGSWTIRLEPLSPSAFADLSYERWVRERRELVDKASSGRIGYVHIKAMDQPSLRRFEKELREYQHKEALIIDERFNGGGNIEQELLSILVRRPYEVWRPRGTEATSRPFEGFFGPKAVLQNWRSASNAEMFPAGFRALGLGKLVGTPTMGAVIGTGSYSLVDGSTIRTPGVGVYLADTNTTNMENGGVKPDVFVENSPEDNLAGRDRQLESAIELLLKQIPQKSPVAAASAAR